MFSDVRIVVVGAAYFVIARAVYCGFLSSSAQVVHNSIMYTHGHSHVPDQNSNTIRSPGYFKMFLQVCLLRLFLNRGWNHSNIIIDRQNIYIATVMGIALWPPPRSFCAQACAQRCQLGPIQHRLHVGMIALSPTGWQ